MLWFSKYSYLQYSMKNFTVHISFVSFVHYNVLWAFLTKVLTAKTMQNTKNAVELQCLSQQTNYNSINQTSFVSIAHLIKMFVTITWRCKLFVTYWTWEGFLTTVHSTTVNGQMTTLGETLLTDVTCERF